MVGCGLFLWCIESPRSSKSPNRLKRKWRHMTTVIQRLCRSRAKGAAEPDESVALEEQISGSNEPFEEMASEAISQTDVPVMQLKPS